MNNHKDNKCEINMEDLNDIFKFVTGISLLSEIKEETIDVNSLLDQYNDNITLYKMFGDEEYITKANNVMKKLKSLK